MLDFLVGNDLLSAIVAFALVLIPAVIIHELGHLFAAKAVGITILEFGIGFPPRIAKLFRWGETEFTLNLLPLGGFVRPLGEDFVKPVADETVQKDREALAERMSGDNSMSRLSPQEQDEVVARGLQKTMSVNEAKPLGRIFFMAAGALANFVSAFILFVVVAMVGVPEIVGGRVNVISVEPDSILAQAGLQNGDIIEQVNGEPVLSSGEFFDRLDGLSGEDVVVLVRRGEMGDPIELNVSIPATLDQVEDRSYIRVMGIVEGAPADNAGIEPGDLIVNFDDATLVTSEELQTRTLAEAGNEVTLTVRRGDEMLDFQIVPRVNPPEGEGAMGIIIQPAFEDTTFGVLFQEGLPQRITVSRSLGEAIPFSFGRIGDFITTIASVPGQLLRGTVSVEQARPISIIGISQVGGRFLQQSIEDNQPVVILNYIALISIALGLTNLLPLPALDGGRIMFVLLEVVRGRPIAPEREGLVHLVGLALLLSATLVFVLNDLLNPVTDLLR